MTCNVFSGTLNPTHFTSLLWGRGLAPPPFWEGRPHLRQSPGPKPTSIPSGILIHAAIWPQQIWAENSGGCAPLGRGSWVPIKHNAARAEAYVHVKFQFDPSNRLATVHQRTNVTDRQIDRQTDRQTGQRSDSIGRAVLQTVAQKMTKAHN